MTNTINTDTTPLKKDEITENIIERSSHKEGRKSIVVTKKEEIHTSTVITKANDNLNTLPVSTTY